MSERERAISRLMNGPMALNREQAEACLPDNLIEPIDDREAARFADELIAITTAERAVVNAAMALADEWEVWFREKNYDLTAIGDAELAAVLAACRALRLTRKVLG